VYYISIDLMRGTFFDALYLAFSLDDDVDCDAICALDDLNVSGITEGLV
jgi:hypothetical protein